MLPISYPYAASITYEAPESLPCFKQMLTHPDKCYESQGCSWVVVLQLKENSIVRPGKLRSPSSNGGIMIVLYLTSTKAKLPKHLAKKEPNKMLRGEIFNLPFLMC